MDDSALSGRPSGAWTDYVLVALVAGAIMFWRLGAATLDDHESKLALVTRTMTDRSQWLIPDDQTSIIPPDTPFNRWVVPVENGGPRLNKTPLPYWAAAGVALAYRAVGGQGPAVNNFTARFPSAAAAVLCAMVVLALGRRMFSQRAALLGALLMATCVGFQKWGRDARPEMMLCLLITAAMAVFYCGIEAGTRRGFLAWMVAFWVLLGLANLAKQFVPFLAAWPIVAYLFWRQSFLDRGDGVSLRWLRVFLIATAVGLTAHVAVAMLPVLRWWRFVGIGNELGSYLTLAAAFGLPMLWYAWATRPWRQIVSLLPTAVPGLLLAVAMFAWWLLYMRNLFPGLADEVLAHEVTDRGAGVGTWAVDSPSMYLLALSEYPLPWLVLIPGAWAVGLMRRFERHRSGLVYLLLWCIGFVVLFTAAAGKREHYILPMIPAFCLLMGYVAEDVFFRHVWIRPRLTRWIGAGYGLAGLIGVAVTGVQYFRSGRDARWMHMGIVAVAVAGPAVLGAVMIWWRRFRAGLAMLLASITLVYVGYYNWVELWDVRRPVADFATSAAAMIGPEAPVCSWGDPEAKTVFYLGRYIPSVHWPFQRAKINTSLTQAAISWLAEDPSRGPWMFGYREDARILEPLGYAPVLTVRSEEKKARVFVLYRRDSATSRPVSPSAPSDTGSAASAPARAED